MNFSNILGIFSNVSQISILFNIFLSISSIFYTRYSCFRISLVCFKMSLEEIRQNSLFEAQQNHKSINSYNHVKLIFYVISISRNSVILALLIFI